MNIIDLKGWAEKSPIIAWASFLSTIILALLGAINLSIDVYTKINSLVSSSSLAAVIERMEMQSKNNSWIAVNYHNPTNKNLSVTYTALRCTNNKTSMTYFLPLKTPPMYWDASEKKERTHTSLQPGDSKSVRYDLRQETVAAIMKNCQSIHLIWSDGSEAIHKSDTITLAPNTVSYNSMIMSRI